jgi:hypothetical protein
MSQVSEDEDNVVDYVQLMIARGFAQRSRLKLV